MYPRNAASPEPIAIGPVVQISDGAVQTSGCTVRIFPAGGAEGNGAGATAYSTDGVVLYTPTQAETNYTSFILIAKKAGCIPACTTVVTSASATAGYAGTDQSKIANPTATVALTNTTINDAQKVDLNTVKTRAVADYGSGHTYYLGGDDAANGAAGGIAIVGSNMGTVTLANGAHGGAAATLVLSDYSAFKATGFSTLTAQQVWEYTTRTLSAFSFTVAATGNWTTDADIAQLLSDLATAHGAGSWATATSVTVSDKSGFSLASTGLDLVTAWTVDITGTVSGNSTHTAANVASLILTTPANKLATDTSGYVTFNNTSIATVTTLTNAPPDSAGVGTLLTRVPQVISMAQIGGAGAYYVEVLDATGAAVAPAATALSTATWTATKAGYLDAAISTRQATVTNLANVVTMAAQFSTMIVLDGAVYDFTAAALAAAPSGSGLSAQEVRDAMKLAPTAGDPAAGSVDKHLDDILDDTGTTLPAAIAAVPTAAEIDTQLSGTHGAGTWGSSGAGTGSRTIVFTVTASSVALQGARVRLYRTGSTDRAGDTDASGQLTLYCDVDATWSYVVTHPLYDPVAGTVVVDGNEAIPVAMTTIAVTAATDPDQTTAYWYVYGNDGALVGSADVTATIEIVDVPDDRGYAYDDTPLTLTTTAGGLMSALLFKGAKYKVTLSDNREWTIDVPRNAGTTYRLPPIRVVES